MKRESYRYVNVLFREKCRMAKEEQQELGEELGIGLGIGCWTEHGSLEVQGYCFNSIPCF